MLPAPTSSAALEPTRLFAALTAPTTPLVPLPNVAAPAFVTAPLAQLKLRKIGRASWSAVMHPSLTLSPAVEPTSVFAALTVPTTPPVPLPNVAAPAFVSPPLAQFLLRTT